MDYEEFATEFLKLCASKPACVIDELVLPTWWETVNDKPICLPGLKFAFKQLRLRGNSFMPPVSDLVDLACYEANRINTNERAKLKLPEPTLTDAQIEYNLKIIRDAKENLVRRFSKPWAN